MYILKDLGGSQFAYKFFAKNFFGFQGSLKQIICTEVSQMQICCKIFAKIVYITVQGLSKSFSSPSLSLVRLLVEPQNWFTFEGHF